MRVESSLKMSLQFFLSGRLKIIIEGLLHSLAVVVVSTHDDTVVIPNHHIEEDLADQVNPFTIGFHTTHQYLHTRDSYLVLSL